MKKTAIFILIMIGAHLAQAQMISSKAMPKQTLSHHADKLPKLKNSNIVVLANATLKKIKPEINRNLKMKMVLSKMLKDKSINTAGTGAFILASGGYPKGAVYLIWKGILKNPKNPWPINDLGVYFRDKGNYPKSLQCYFYANSLDTGHSKVINANIGWASAYYGDFNTAMKYFDKALAIDKNYSEALEGEALIAYQQGDTKKLMACLAKELKFMGITGGAGNDGPSDAKTGNTGDYYLDKNSGNLYGPKTNNGWGTALSLKGPEGAKGATGSQGPKGNTGATGAQGTKGNTGAAGKPGSQILSGNGAPSNSAGTNGDYYLDKTNKTLYGSKTGGAWGAGLKLNGNADVMVFEISPSAISWTLNARSKISGSDDSLFQWISKFIALLIPASDTLGGAWMAYIEGIGDSPLPFSFDASDYSVNLTFIYGGPILEFVCQVIIHGPDNTLRTPYHPYDIFPSTSVEVVFIPATTLTEIEVKRPGINLKDYHAVAKTLKLDE